MRQNLLFFMRGLEYNNRTYRTRSFLLGVFSHWIISWLDNSDLAIMVDRSPRSRHRDCSPSRSEGSSKTKGIETTVNPVTVVVNLIMDPI